VSLSEHQELQDQEKTSTDSSFSTYAVTHLQGTDTLLHRYHISTERSSQQSRTLRRSFVEVVQSLWVVHAIGSRRSLRGPNTDGLAWRRYT